MITLNYYKMLSNMIRGYMASYPIMPDGSQAIYGVTISSMLEDIYALGTQFKNDYVSTTTSVKNTASRGVVIGSGTDEENISDIKLVNRIDPSKVSMNVVTVVNDDRTEFVKTITITNLSSDDITISEVGLQVSSTNGSQTFAILVDRTLLAEPVTIPSGGVGQVIYTLNIP